VSDSQSLVLLDKDRLLPPLPPASDKDYIPKPPTAKAFDDCCNEFWWVSTYVAKGLWRQEILFAKHFMDHHVRVQLMKMVEWYIGMRTQFSRSPGKYGKYVQQYLEPEEWYLLCATYSDAGTESTWEALFSACALFRFMARQVADHFGFPYRQADDERVSAHLEHVRRLPREAEEIY
jgi:aminoglycoside 6-adenylyltransferase